MSLSSEKSFFLTLFSGIIIGTALTTVATASFAGSTIFSDVPVGHFADDAIGRMHELGVIKGRDAAHFDPNGSLTRAEAALLMDRLYVVMNGNAASKSSSSVASSEWHSVSSIARVSSSSPSSSSSTWVVAVSSIYSLSATEYGVMENGGSVVITVVRTGETGQANVSYSTTSDTATSYDYGAAGGTLAFAAGETSKTFTITAKDNSNIEGSRKLSVALSSPSLGGNIGSQGTAFVVIYDDESTELTDVSTFRFTSANFILGHGTGHGYFTVKRSGGLGPASVSYTTQNLTATAEGHYHSATGVLNFAIGETIKFIPVLMSESSAGVGKTFQIQLSNPVSGSLSDLNLATITIN